MRKLISVVFVVLFVFALVVPASAQDMMEDKIVCDSTLITLLFVAEYEYGYEPMMDVSVFEKGQYAPLFDSMMSMMEEGDMMEEEMMDEGEGEMMEEDTMMDDMMMLSPGNVTDEPAECTELRASVESFLYDHYSMSVGMMEDDM